MDRGQTSEAERALRAGNVYLMAAALGLGAWFHNGDRPSLAAKLGLGPDERVLFAQTVGHPSEVGSHRALRERPPREERRSRADRRAPR